MTDVTDPSGIAKAVLKRQTALDVAFRYVDRVDAADIDGVAALFDEDATVWLLGIERRGREAIGTHLRRALSTFDATSHHVTNPLVSVDGDQAEVSAGVYAWHLRSSGDWWHFYGRYRFRLRRRDQGWSVTHLRLDGIGGGPDAHPAERDLYTGHPDRRR